MAQIGPRGPEDADEIEAWMFEEALVFGGENRLDQGWREIFVAHRASLIALAVEEIGNEFRLDFGDAHVRAASRQDGCYGSPCR